MKGAIPFCGLFIALLWLGACSLIHSNELPLPPTYVEVPYTDLALETLDQNLLTDPGIPGCDLADLPPFGWKEVDSGLVDIRRPEDYAIRVGSLYQEGYRTYLDNRLDYPETYQTLPEMSYEEFLATCDVFPAVDFGQYSLLGAHAAGTGCSVAFEKHVYRDDGAKKIIYDLAVVQEGNCERDVRDRNLILVPRIPPDYNVDFRISKS